MFDVFTVSETWPNNSVTNLEIEILGYDIFHIDRNNKVGGSVCVDVLNVYKTELLSNISTISNSGFHQL